MKIITRTVWILSLVSLFTDVASEMLYPVMPVYLKEIGFSILLIGILEGVAEATAGLSKSYFGKLSDVSGKRLPFVQLGYLLSAISKPMMAVFIYPLWIFFSRTTDRIGKGLRTGARDAMLSDEATPQTKGRVFGLHRAMDTLGAVIGPGVALIYLYFYPGNYTMLFYIAFIPGILAISFTFFIHERKKNQHKIDLKSVSLFSFAYYWKDSPQSYKKLVIGLLAFTCINSSDVFLLLKVKDAGLDDASVIGVYIFYNLIYALAAYPIGRLSDKIGFKKTFIIGLFLFAFVYTGMAMANQLYLFFILFFLYGLYAAATESIAKAWISNISDKKDTATAIGTYTGFQSVCTMLASALAGWIWFSFGAGATFLFSGITTLLIILYVILIIPKPNPH
jgi:MFS family permease